MSGTKSMEPASRRLPVMGAAFLLGALGGSLACARLPAVQSFLLARGQLELTFWQAAWPELLLLGAMGLSAFLRSGCFTALLTMAGKGCFLAAEAAVLVSEWGSRGYAAALAQCFLPGFFALAALVLSGRQAMGYAAERMRLPAVKSRRIRPDGAFFLTLLICGGLILLSAALRLWLSPKLWTAVQTFLPME